MEVGRIHDNDISFNFDIAGLAEFCGMEFSRIAVEISA